jgi:threonine/homoserine/homoserine lactone efflux protein
MSLLPLETLALFALASLLLALTPGPNWVYLLSRTLCQGRRAGLVSWAGTTLGFTFHMAAAVLGLSALLLAVPYAYDAVRWLGVAYLLYLAWATLRGARDLTGPNAQLAVVPNRTLFTQGVVSSILNPKIALFYLALLPQFIDPARGSTMLQGLGLGAVQIVVTGLADVALVFVAALVARSLMRHPAWLRTQRIVLGSAFGVLALWLAASRKPA